MFLYGLRDSTQCILIDISISCYQFFVVYLIVDVKINLIQCQCQCQYRWHATTEKKQQKNKHIVGMGLPKKNKKTYISLACNYQTIYSRNRFIHPQITNVYFYLYTSHSTHN